MKKDDWKESGGITLENAAKGAVTCEENTLVVAGPGAGKTELLTQKAGYLFETNSCRMPRRILAISFKKDAADNLKERIVTRYGERYKDRFVSMTYDAFFKSILDRFYRALPEDYSIDINYEIADSDAILKAFLLGDNSELKNMKPYEAKQIASGLINNSVLPLSDNKLKSVWDIMLKGENAYSPAISFQMIAKLALLIVNTNSSIRTVMRATFSHVFLDEFQDTTDIQYEIVKALFKDTDVKLTAVGDNKQRIMLWAGARKTVFQDFYREFNTKNYKLLMNHRSAPRLVELQKNMYASLHDNPENITASTKWDEDDGIINLVIADNNNVEADTLAEMIHGDILGGVKQNDIAILCKQKVDDYACSVINALDKKGIRARIETDYQDLLKDDIIRIILAIIVLANNRKSPEEWEYIQAISEQVFNNVNTSTSAYLKMLEDLEDLFFDVYNNLIKVDSESSFSAVQNMIINFYGEDKLKALFPDNKQGNYLADKLQKFTELFWKEVEIANKDWHRAVKGFRGEESIPIMTIHKSKGLEYDSVYFMGLEDSAFWNFKNQPEEDRCVFFVALSRAKRKITFTYCEYRYNFQYSKQKKSTINEFYELLKKPGMANLILAKEESL